jgi:hypothetical protein
VLSLKDFEHAWLALYVYLCMYMYMYVCICMYVYVYVCMHVGKFGNEILQSPTVLVPGALLQRSVGRHIFAPAARRPRNGRWPKELRALHKNLSL